MAKSDVLQGLLDTYNSRKYDDSSISKLEGEERVRTRPEALLGSNGIDGAQHTVYEIIGNANDEALSGYGDKLIVSKYEDGAISVRDFGRGVPLGWNEEAGEWNYYLIYEELYAGGKYTDSMRQEILHKIDEAGVWDEFNILDFEGMVSIGLNGLGAAATQCSSAYCEVISYRDGKASRMYYEKGRHVLDALEITDTDEPNGTFIKWKPDDEVFTDTNIKSKWLKEVCRQTSSVTGLSVTFINKGIEEGHWDAKSLKDTLLEDVDNAISFKNFIHTVDKDNDICVCQAEVALGSSGKSPEFFHNMISIRGGAHSKACNSAIYAFFDDISKERGIKIKEPDYTGKFSIICSTLSNKMSVRGQTKDSVDDFFIFQCIYDAIYNNLKNEYTKGTPWVMDIIDEVISNAQLRIIQEENNKNLKEVTKSIKRHKASEKFTSCEAYEKGRYDEVEYFIVEGDSAGGRVVTARDSVYQALLAIRGKSLNVYKATISQLIANREIKDMISSLGCGIDLSGLEDFDTFNINNLKVGKIIFLADADIDGKHIIMLLFLIFYKLFPELLYQGKVYVADTPLYVINKNNGDCEFCMDEEELAEKRAEIGEHNIHSVDRFKGLGETEADDLWNTTLNPATRHLRQIKLERNDMELTDVLEVLFGKSTERRKRAILGSMMDNFDEVMEEQQSISEMIESMGLAENSLEVEEVAY